MLLQSLKNAYEEIGLVLKVSHETECGVTSTRKSFLCV